MTSNKVEQFSYVNQCGQPENIENKINQKTKLLAPKPVRSPPLTASMCKILPKMVFSPIEATSRLAQLRSFIEFQNNNEETKGQLNKRYANEEDSKCSSTTCNSSPIGSAFTIFGVPLPSVERNKTCIDKLEDLFTMTKKLNEDDDESSSNREVIKRWNRTDDKNLFHIIREISSTEKIDLDEVIENITSNESSPYWKMILPIVKSQVENWSDSQTKEHMEKKNMKFFMRRVQKLNNMRSVSRREHKLIRKLLRTNKDSNGVDWSSILFHFPGKRLEELKDYTTANFAKYF